MILISPNDELNLCSFDSDLIGSIYTILFLFSLSFAFFAHINRNDEQSLVHHYFVIGGLYPTLTYHNSLLSIEEVDWLRSLD